jgi:hypothetical protein
VRSRVWKRSLLPSKEPQQLEDTKWLQEHSCLLPKKPLVQKQWMKLLKFKRKRCEILEKPRFVTVFLLPLGWLLEVLVFLFKSQQDQPLLD